MISAIFTPMGIVLGTLAQDTFLQMRRMGEQDNLEPIRMTGLPHRITFGGQFGLVFQQMDQFRIDRPLLTALQHLACSRAAWDDPEDFLDALQDTLAAHRDMMGIVAYYQQLGDERVPRVYQLHGDDMQLININDREQPVYSLFYMEQEPILGRLFRGARQMNGDKWEEIPPLQPRADVYSLTKARDLTRFVHQTHWYAAHLDEAMMSQMPDVELLTVTEQGVTLD